MGYNHAVTPTNSNYPNVWLRGAVIVLAIVALCGAAFVIPGSPVPAWFKQAGARIGGDEAAMEEPADTVDTTTLMPAVTSVTIPPTKHFSIVFAAPQDSGTAYLFPTDGFNITVSAIGGAPQYKLTSADRLDVDNTGLDSSYEIEVPLSANYVELVIGERHILLKDQYRFGEDLLMDERGRRVIPLQQ